MERLQAIDDFWCNDSPRLTTLAQGQRNEACPDIVLVVITDEKRVRGRNVVDVAVQEVAHARQPFDGEIRAVQPVLQTLQECCAPGRMTHETLIPSRQDTGTLLVATGVEYVVAK